MGSRSVLSIDSIAEGVSHPFGFIVTRGRGQVTLRMTPFEEEEEFYCAGTSHAL